MVVLFAYNFNPFLLVFQMIPGSGSKLEDVMFSLKENNEKLHDANVR